MSPHATPPAATSLSPADASFAPDWGARRHAGRGRSHVRWGALAIGSVTGIASWALLYVLGAACSAPPSAAAPSLGLGLYAAFAAALALAAGSFVASRSGGATTRQTGVLYGVTMAGMANITLVGAAMALDADWFVTAPPLVRGVVQVGAAALAMAAGEVGHGASTPSTLAAMAATMTLSLACGAWGGVRGAVGRAV